MSNDNDQPTGLDDALVLEAENRADDSNPRCANCVALFDGSALTVNILRLWDRDRIERFALHLLGDDWQGLKAENERLQGYELRYKALEPKLRDCEQALRDAWAENERLKAYEKGFDAGEEDWEEDSNPYPEGTEQQRGWKRGYKAARSVHENDYLRKEYAILSKHLAASEADRNHAIATMVAASASACLGDTGFKGKTIAQQVGGAVAAIEQMKTERDDLQASLAWLVESVIRHHDIVATPNYEAWLKRAKECGKQWRERTAEDYDLITELRGDVTRLEADNTRLRQQISDPTAAHDPQWDATDAACECWWRAHDYTAKVFCQHVTEILDGQDDGVGANTEPWRTVRRQLLGLVLERDKWKHRAKLFQEAYKEKDVESFALNLQKLQLESLGTAATLIKQRDSLKSKYLESCRERNALRQQVREIGEKVKARAVEIADNYSKSRPDWHLAAISIRNMVDSINVADLAVCGAKAEEAGDRLGENHPLAHLFGKFDNDPMWPDFQAAIDAEPNVIDGPPAPPAKQEDEGNG